MHFQSAHRVLSLQETLPSQNNDVRSFYDENFIIITFCLLQKWLLFRESWHVTILSKDYFIIIFKYIEEKKKKKSYYRIIEIAVNLEINVIMMNFNNKIFRKNEAALLERGIRYAGVAEVTEQWILIEPKDLGELTPN